jgi:hypothetical protein
MLFACTASRLELGSGQPMGLVSPNFPTADKAARSRGRSALREMRVLIIP